MVYEDGYEDNIDESTEIRFWQNDNFQTVAVIAFFGCFVILEIEYNFMTVIFNEISSMFRFYYYLIQSHLGF
jgi:hypothetical protein